EDVRYPTDPRKFLPASGPPVPEDTLAYGAGFALGTQVDTRVTSRLHLLLDGSVGGLRFDREIPGPDAAKFNFTAQGGGGLTWGLTRRYALSARVQYHHISNGNATMINPGVNGVVYQIGISALTRRLEQMSATPAAPAPSSH